MSKIECVALCFVTVCIVTMIGLSCVLVSVGRTAESLTEFLAESSMPSSLHIDHFKMDVNQSDEWATGGVGDTVVHIEIDNLTIEADSNLLNAIMILLGSHQ